MKSYWVGGTPAQSNGESENEQVEIEDAAALTRVAVFQLAQFWLLIRMKPRLPEEPVSNF